MFDSSVDEKLGYYVYALFDPDKPHMPFYIGKGRGNRVFAHAAGDVESTPDDVLSPKMELIRSIHKRGKQVIHKIVKYNLMEDAAFAVEAALIDFINYLEPDSLRNEVSGHGSARLIDATDLAIMLQAAPLRTTRPVLLIKIDRQWDKLTENGRSPSSISAQEVYEAVRGNWRISVPRAQRAECIAAVARGVVRGVFVAEQWVPVEGDRVAFLGKPAQEAWDEFVNKSVMAEFPRGGQNPVRYLSC